MAKKTSEIIEEYELPDCPKELIKEMNEKKLTEGEVCKKCKYNNICNLVWYSEKEIKKIISKLFK